MLKLVAQEHRFILKNGLIFRLHLDRNDFLSVEEEFFPSCLMGLVWTLGSPAGGKPRMLKLFFRALWIS